jgi:hypothetical protein
MNPELQESMINAALVNAGIDPELFDTSAHIDRNLHADENLKNIKRMHGISNNHYREQNMETPFSGFATTPLFPKKTINQTGTSNIRLDELYSAKLPGLRFTPWGTSYTETRKNRSDKPGRRV